MRDRYGGGSAGAPKADGAVCVDGGPNRSWGLRVVRGLAIGAKEEPGIVVVDGKAGYVGVYVVGAGSID